MKTSLDHLPEHKREQLATITALLQADAQAEMVILFGSHARRSERCPGQVLVC